MLEFLAIFLASLALAWGIGLCIGARIHIHQTSVPDWHPAFFMASYLVNGLHMRAAIVFALVGMLCVVAGIFLHNILGIFLLTAGLIIFAPLAFYLCYKIRENAALGSKEYIFFNVFRPLSTSDEQRDIALYIEDDEWVTISAATPHYVKFWQQFHVTDGLYICPCNNEVLQVIDSLNLYSYIVHPENPKMLNAFANALSAVNPGHTSQTAYARRTLIQLQTQAQGALSVQKKDKSEKIEKEDDEDEDRFRARRKKKFSHDLPPEIMKMFQHLEDKEKSSPRKLPLDLEKENDDDDDDHDDDSDEDLDDWEKEFLKDLEKEPEENLPDLEKTTEEDEEKHPKENN